MSDHAMDKRISIFSVLIFISLVLECATNQTCTPKNCFNLRYEEIASKYYKGIFMTKEEIYRMDSRWRGRQLAKCHKPLSLFRYTRSAQCAPHDHDSCCPTQLSHQCESHLHNTNGVLKAIFHMWFLDPPKFQWYPHATCMGSGSCSGNCQVKKITVYLLVYSMRRGWPFEFDSFEVNGYCSCQNSEIVTDQLQEATRK